MWLRKGDDESRLDVELRYHFERLVREAMAAGATPEEARRRARLEFGGLEQIKEDCRDERGRWLEDFGKDLRYAARGLRRRPGFLVVSVLSLALGIGANTAIFSLINAVMLRSLPVKEPGRLVRIARVLPDGRPVTVSYPLFLYFRDHLKSLSAAEAETSSEITIVMEGAEEPVSGELVSGGHYATMGVEPAAGRLLEPADDVVSAKSGAAVISYRYWQRRFGLDPGVIGKTFAIGARVFTIVGVTETKYEGTRTGRDPDITLPLAMMLSEEQRNEPTNNFLIMLGRLKPGVTAREANAEVQVLWKSFLEPQAMQVPEKDRRQILNQRTGAYSAADGFNPIREDYTQALVVLMGIAGLVLLLACANMAGMLLARAAARQREVSIRLAIGAGTGRLMRQFLAESFLLALPGGCAGLLLASWFSRGLVNMLANGGNLILSTSPDWRVFGFTAAVTLLACVLAGLAPGLHVLRANLNPSLKPARADHLHAGKLLVVGQLSISMVLLTGATLFIGTLVNLYSIDRGVRTNGVLIFSVRSSERYTQKRVWAIQAAVLDRLAALPGVKSASAAQVVPLSGGEWTRDVQVEGNEIGTGEKYQTGFNVIAPNYFTTVGTPLVSGREFNERDTNTGPKVAIVNESFARLFFGGRSPLGRRVTSVKVTYEIVGMVKDAKNRNLRADLTKMMYIPWTQREGDQPSNCKFLVRVTTGNPMRLSAVLDRLVREADPGLRLRTSQTYSDLIDRSIVTERMMATLGGLFGALALMVASLGTFGVMAFQVSRRINEMGVRMALGASRVTIVMLVLREVAAMLLIGCVAGSAAALTLSGLARKMLFGLTATQPGVFGMAAVILAITAFTAGWLPALKASRIDPLIALRHD